MSDTVVVVRDPSIVTVVRDPGVVTVAQPGVQGEPGPQGPVGGTGLMAYVYTTSTPAQLHQIHHDLTFQPAGIWCEDADGIGLFFFQVSRPAPGITEVSFGMPVTPTIWLS